MGNNSPSSERAVETPVERLRRVERIYHEALEHETEQTAFLAEACGEDEALHNEIQSLLAARKRAGDFLARPAIEEHAWSLGSATHSDAAAATSPSNRIGLLINQYKILSPLGKGGMGEVWLAEDTQLHRQVALKLLPPKFTAQAGYVRRFRQEAQAVIALNHPNIVTLFDFGQSDNGHFMATEFIDGQTLRARLQTNGHLPVGEAIEIALSICQALDAAHKIGIVHRDIKPENVMQRHDGLVKVLDFGLAKIQETPGGVFPALASDSLTAAGAVVGTVSYMSPEQARGEKVDARTDLFSLGVALYEMLTGQTPFAGQTAGDRIASLLRSEPPPVTGLPFNIGEEMNRVLRLALAKDRNQRYESATAFAAELKTILRQLQLHSRLSAKADPAGNPPASQTDSPTKIMSAHSSTLPANRLVRRRVATIAIITALSTLLGWQFLANRQKKFESTILFTSQPTPVTSWKAELEANHLLMDISPNGDFIALSKGQRGQTDIFVRRINGEEFSVTNDPYPDQSPIWSPDGQELAYLSKRNDRWEVRRKTWPNGDARTVRQLDAKPLWLTRWSGDGKRIFLETDGRLFALNADTGDLQKLTERSGGEEHFSISPQEDWLVYEGKVGDTTHIFARPLTGDAPRQLTRGGEDNRYPIWLPDGQVIAHGSERNGVSQICLTRLDQSEPTKCRPDDENLIPWNVSPDGSKIFFIKERHESELAIYDQRQIPLPSGIQLDLYPQFSPLDAPQILFQQIDAGENLFNGVISIFASGRITPLPIKGFDARWSPDGKQIAFLRGIGKTRGLYLARSDGRREHLLTQGVQIGSFHNQSFAWNQPANFSWSPQNNSIAFVSNAPGAPNVYRINTETGTKESLSQDEDATAQLNCPLWSADGNLVAYLWEKKTAGTKEYRVKLWQAGRITTLYQSTRPLRMVGWSDSGKEFFVAQATTDEILMPVEMKLLQLPVDGGQPVEIKPLPAAMFNSVILSPDRRTVAFVSRPQDQDEIRLVGLKTKPDQTLTTAFDPYTYFSNLTWTADQRQLCFTKQSNKLSISTIENFR